MLQAFKRSFNWLAGGDVMFIEVSENCFIPISNIQRIEYREEKRTFGDGYMRFYEIYLIHNYDKYNNIVKFPTSLKIFIDSTKLFNKLARLLSDSKNKDKSINFENHELEALEILLEEESKYDSGYHYLIEKIQKHLKTTVESKNNESK